MLQSFSFLHYTSSINLFHGVFFLFPIFIMITAMPNGKITGQINTINASTIAPSIPNNMNSPMLSTMTIGRFGPNMLMRTLSSIMFTTLVPIHNNHMKIAAVPKSGNAAKYIMTSSLFVKN